MIRVFVIGGLGNQMFQYAAARAISLNCGAKLIVDASAFSYYKVNPFRLDKLNCSSSFEYKPTITTHLSRFPLGLKILSFFSFTQAIYIEREFSFNAKVYELSKNARLIGYFQSEKYFRKIRDKLLQEFMPKNGLSIDQSRLAIEIQESVSVSVHVRRGDFLLKRNNVHGVCSKEYFDNSLRYISSRISNPKQMKVFVFSDDIAWCKENISFDHKVVFVEGDAEKPELDMYLMSLSKHQIISNSTFSWWAAWLNTYHDKVVIAPKYWFSDASLDAGDVIPNDWVRI